MIDLTKAAMSHQFGPNVYVLDMYLDCHQLGPYVLGM